MFEPDIKDPNMDTNGCT